MTPRNFIERTTVAAGLCKEAAKIMTPSPDDAPELLNGIAMAFADTLVSFAERLTYFGKKMSQHMGGV